MGKNRGSCHTSRLIFFVVCLLSLVVFVLTAIANYGYHHADELFQIIEYAGIKSGTFSPLVAWEYGYHIRPMLQPAICLVFLKLFSLLSVTDPFTQALVMRLFASLLSYVVILLFVRSTVRKMSGSRDRLCYLVISLSLWFVPYIACRFSSETFGGLFFLLALAMYFSGKEKRLYQILVGLFFAFSFIFRFQMGVAIFGFALWSLFIDKCGWRCFLMPVSSFAVAYLLFGIGVDRWFYGEWVFAPYQYVKVNAEVSGSIVSGSMFGTSPWWFYFSNLLSYPSYFVGIPMAIAVIYLLVRQPKNPWLWCFLPFLAIHSLIGHKEMRFMFPMAFLFPAILMSAFLHVKEKLKGNRLWKSVGYVLLVFFVAANLLGLWVNMTKSAGYQKLYLAKYINVHFNEQEVNIIHGPDANPYGPFGAISGFYRNDYATMRNFTNIYGMGLLLRQDAVNFFTCRKCDLEKMVCTGEFEGKNPFDLLRKSGYEFVSQSVPKFTERLFRHYSGFDTGMILYVFRYVGNHYGIDSAICKNASLYYSDFESFAERSHPSLTTECRYSGERSLLVWKNAPYSISFEDSVEKVVPEVRHLSVSLQLYQLGKEHDACIVFELLRSEDDKVVETRKVVDVFRKIERWEGITLHFDLPDNFREYAQFRIYLYNPSDIRVYGDDLLAVFY